jgi:eukaryotic-like serine/threonine-protein kinase
MTSVTDRIKVTCSSAGDSSFRGHLPECDAINFAPHATQPTLMVNGRFDYFFPLETSQVPLFGNYPQIRTSAT